MAIKWSRRHFLTLAVASAAGGALGQPALALGAQGDIAQQSGLASLAAPLRLQSRPSSRRTVAFNQDLWAFSDEDAQTLDKALAGAIAHGLDASGMRAALSGVADGAGRQELLLRATLRLALALSQGLADPATITPIYTLPRRRSDVVVGLRRALRAGSLGPWLEGLSPADDEYRRLSSAYLASLDAVAADARLQRLPPGPLKDAWTPSEGPSPKAEAGGSRQDLISNPGAEEAPSPAGLSSPERARALALNLERRRWLERSPPFRRIDVNLPAARLTYFRAGEPFWRARVAVGRPDDPTPELEAPFSDLVVNPPWRPPESVVRSEILPRGREYLRAEHMRWTAAGLVQRPGPWAAMGLVKFDLQDPYAIYLHDTPAKGVFDGVERDLSHGCVRVEDAVAFARMLAGEAGQTARFDAALSSGRTEEIRLGSPIPVRLLYHTAYVEADGLVSIADDIYGRDEGLARALGMAPLYGAEGARSA